MLGKKGYVVVVVVVLDKLGRGLCPVCNHSERWLGAQEGCVQSVMLNISSFYDKLIKRLIYEHTLVDIFSKKKHLAELLMI